VLDSDGAGRPAFSNWCSGDRSGDRSGDPTERPRGLVHSDARESTPVHNRLKTPASRKGGPISLARVRRPDTIPRPRNTHGVGRSGACVAPSRRARRCPATGETFCRNRANTIAVRLGSSSFFHKRQYLLSAVHRSVTGIRVPARIISLFEPLEIHIYIDIVLHFLAAYDESVLLRTHFRTF